MDWRRPGFFNGVVRPWVSAGAAAFGGAFSLGAAQTDCYRNLVQPTYPDFGVSEYGYGL